MVPCPICSSHHVRVAIQVEERVRYRCVQCGSTFDVAETQGELATPRRSLALSFDDSTPVVTIRPPSSAMLEHLERMVFDDGATTEAPSDALRELEERG